MLFTESETNFSKLLGGHNGRSDVKYAVQELIVGSLFVVKGKTVVLKRRESIEMVWETFDRSETRIIVNHMSPGMEDRLTQIALVLRIVIPLILVADDRLIL